jgi:hypothetical protein
MVQQFTFDVRLISPGGAAADGSTAALAAAAQC